MIVAVAHHTSAEDLSAAVLPHALEVTSVEARSTPWGAVVVVNGPFASGGAWLVAGMPLADPWGLPGTPLSPAVVASELDRYGPAAIQQVAGPVVAIDMLSGGVLRAMNGIVPVFTGRGGPWVASTCAAVVAATGTDVKLVPCASYQPPGGLAAVSWEGSIENPARGLTWATLDSEVRAAASRLGRLSTACLPPVDGVDDADVDAVTLAERPYAVFLPHLTDRREARGGAARYQLLRNEIGPKLWWQARLIGIWLCAPALERPAHNMAMAIAQTGRRIR